MRFDGSKIGTWVVIIIVGVILVGLLYPLFEFLGNMLAGNVLAGLAKEEA
jgi:hypothetical protein